jgi:large subunit ribosomal protein L6
MSRIGNAPVTVPKGVTITPRGQTLSIKGPKGTLELDVPPVVGFSIDGDTIKFTRKNESRQARAMHGMARARTRNIVEGVSTGYTIELEIVGVGYRAAVRGDSLDLTLGFSHGISYKLPAGVKAEVTKEGRIVLTGADRVVLGQVASDVRGYREPEPYKGKGIMYAGERVLRKEGKRGKK